MIRTPATSWIVATLIVAVVAGACSGPSAKLAEPGPGVGGPRMLRALVPFDDCDDLLDHIKSEALDHVGPYGLDTGTPGIWFGADTVSLVEEMEAGDLALDASSTALAPAPRGVTTSAPADGDAGSTDIVVGTNVQERGVDEPDVVKTDGNRILLVSEGILTLVDVASSTARGSIRLPEGWDHELFFEADRALVFSNTGAWADPVPLADGPAPEPAVDDAALDTNPTTSNPPTTWASEPWVEPAAIITEIDLSDPDDLRVAGTLKVEGRYLSARLVEGQVRLALSSAPARLPWIHPGGPGSEDRAESFNRQIVLDSTIDDWLPDLELTVGDRSERAPLLSCERVHRPSRFAGFEVISVLSFDMGQGLGRGAGAGVLASGRTVYSSTDAFYVATTRWASSPDADAVDRGASEGVVTDIHVFTIDPGSPARYTASGSVAGSLLDRLSMDEHDGYLRVITTSSDSWGTTDDSESSLSVLAVDGDELVTVGSVDGLGHGEALYSARILDDVAFAVTFRRTDPFFVIDLSDPGKPEVEGELKLPGFSTYLHPLPGDRVLGIGQDATGQGRTTGFKITLFDVADPRSPTEVASWNAPGATSIAEHDPRAFQLVGDIAVVPLQDWSRGFNGAVLLEIGQSSITEIGRITHDVAAEREGCSPVEPESLGDGSNELAWIAEEGGLVLLCSGGRADSDQQPGHLCEWIGIDDLDDWGVSGSPSELRSDLGATADQHVELCWADDGWRSRIVRSLGIGDLLWTMSGSLIQADDLTSLETRATIPIPPIPPVP